ncbi:hypothetical protein [Hymenobacter cavernae]|uniref:Outer membrane protein beta-barrel domain-containing protein n=1 Tax=Hymenobacter cavernae TaxID=2044852 RepID=A0ABQ1TT55_9BACT|nr:hypothetical protein [Hymenobacter cavernae]GGF00965.1 hypothetical protein GCM10011383_09720 [Hymenobacter cavernae]
MNYRPLLLSALLLTSLLPRTGAAQDGPERRRRYYNSQGRPYHRGPVRLTAGLGAGFYNGDLTSSLGNNFPGLSGSLGVLYLLRPHLLVGTELSAFQIGAKDDLPDRNLAFRARNGSGEVFFRYEPFRDEAEFAAPRGPVAFVKPYLKAGVGLLLYNPKSYNGTARPEEFTSFLPPERNDYPAMAIVAPVGLGLTFRLSRTLNATAEAAYYFTTTDYLDDVSKRANSGAKDGYGRAELKVEYAFW